MKVSIAGRYFDGRSAKATAVELLVAEDGSVHTVPAFDETFCFVSELKMDERISGLPATLRFPAGGKFETADANALESCLASHGHRRSWLHRLENHYKAVAVSVVVALAFVAAAYVWALPLLSNYVARKVPRQAEMALGQEALEQLDELVFSPTSLDQQRQQELQRIFERARSLYPELSAAELQLRRGGFISANALALPGATVVLTDEMAAVAANDEQLLAVFLHELGHVQHRHTLRRVVNQSGLGIISLMLFGDVSGLAAVLVAVPTMLAETAFTREMELEADDAAISGLRQLQVPVSEFAALLGRLEAYYSDCRELITDMRRNRNVRPDPARVEACVQEAPADARDGVPRDEAVVEEEESWTSYMSTHPATRERIERLQQAAQ